MIVGLPIDMPKMPDKNHLSALSGYPNNWPNYMQLRNDGTMTADDQQPMQLIDIDDIVT